jgi:hypothetical protein
MQYIYIIYILDETQNITNPSPPPPPPKKRKEKGKANKESLTTTKEMTHKERRKDCQQVQYRTKIAIQKNIH